MELGSVGSFLSDCLDSPSKNAISQTLIFLRKIQAIKYVPTLTDKEIIHLNRNKQFNERHYQRRNLKEFCKTRKDDYNEIGMIENPQSFLNNLENFNLVEDDDDVLTPLGVHLANLPLDPQCAKLLLFGALFGCLEPALSVASCLTNRDPFDIPLNQEIQAGKARFELAQNSFSDHWIYVVVHQVNFSIIFY